MRVSKKVTAAVVASVAAAYGCNTALRTPQIVPPPPITQAPPIGEPGTKINRVFVIFLENHTYDNYFASYPNPGGDPVILDMALSVAARAKIRALAERGEPMPEGWATDAEGRRAIVGLQPNRAEVILAGACIVRAVLGELGHDSLTVCDRGLRHGLVAERLAN